MSTAISQSIFREVFAKEDPHFKFSFEEDGVGIGRITQRSKLGARNLARHYKCNILDDAGSIIRSERIDAGIAGLILGRLGQVNDSELFSLPLAQIENRAQAGRQSAQVDPANVVHVLTDQERSFTATGHKLLHHWPIFKKYKETGYGSIIRATMTNHQVCASKCEFCSTIARNKADSVTLDEAIRFVHALDDEQAQFNRERFPEYNELYRRATGSDIKLRGLILSGGGQPNLWPHFQEFVEHLSTRQIDLGLITNGFPERVADATYEHFKWIRISITPPQASAFYKGGRFENQYFPKNILGNPEIAVGLSYVYGPWTSDDELLRINDFAMAHGLRYARLLTDCNLSRDAQLLAHMSLSQRLRDLGLMDEHGHPLGKIFHQLKYHASAEEIADIWDEGQCQLQSYNVFWDTTGHAEAGRSHCYPCDSVTVLAESEAENFTSSERRFNPDKWGTVFNTEVDRLFTEPVQPFFDPRDLCKACLFVRNNRQVREVSSLSRPPDVSNSIEHVNFP